MDIFNPHFQLNTDFGLYHNYRVDVPASGTIFTAEHNECMAVQAADGAGNISRIQVNHNNLSNIMSMWSNDGGKTWSEFMVGTDTNVSEHIIKRLEATGEDTGFYIRVVDQKNFTFDLHVNEEGLSLFRHDGISWSHLWKK